MKTCFLLLVLAVSLCINIAKAQAPCTIGQISTNPASSTNSIDPSHVNKFDWLQNPNYPYNVSCYPKGLSINPFFSSYSNLLPLSLTKDYKPENGWELIHQNLGYDNDGTISAITPEHAYLILYNRYTGILRVLLKTCRGTDYQGMKMRISFPSGTYQTNLFDFVGDLKALGEPHRTGDAYATVQQFVNDRQAWYYGDFKMNYDPCTCTSDNYAKLNITSNLIAKSNITLEGSITGTITSIAGGTGTGDANNGGHFWKDATNISGIAQKVHGGISSFMDHYDTVYKKLKDAGVTAGAIKKLGIALKDSKFLKAGLAAVPYVGEAVKFLSGFFGGGNSDAGPIQLAPMSLNASVKLSGEITSASTYHDINIGLPGSKKANADPNVYPYYNQTLGVFTLIDQPTMYYEDVAETKKYEARYKESFFRKRDFTVKPSYQFFYRKYKLSSEVIRYAINPAAGLELQDAQVILMTSYEPQRNKYKYYTGAGVNKCFDSSYSGEVLKGFKNIGLKNAQTNYFENASDPIDMNCFATGYLFKNMYKSPTNIPALEEWYDWPGTWPHRSLRASERPSPYGGTWPSTYFTDRTIPSSKCGEWGSILTGNDWPGDWYYQYGGKPYDEFLEPFVKSFSLKLILNFKRTDGLGQNVLHVMTYPIKLIPVPSTVPSTYMSTGVDFDAQQTSGTCYTSLFRQATQAELSSECAGAWYTNNRNYSFRINDNPEIPNAEEPLIVGEPNIFPNPTNTIINISNTNPAIKLLSISNMLGQSIITFGNNTINAKTNTALWQPGVYILKWSKNGKAFSKKFIVQR